LGEGAQSAVSTHADSVHSLFVAFGFFVVKMPRSDRAQLLSQQSASGRFSFQKLIVFTIRTPDKSLTNLRIQLRRRSRRDPPFFAIRHIPSGPFPVLT
jgi:hypothetical protein